ncbi:MAG: class I SAM-dependent methyltransferase [Acidimicrobiia bacterium]
MSEFDEYSDTYRESVQSSIDFGGQELEYYTRRKVDHLLELTARHLDDPARLDFLDVGCGVGETDAFLASCVGALHGVDVASEAVARAAARNPTVSYRAYDGDTLPYEDQAFDVAFSICVVHHVEPPHRARFFREMRRVVRPGGLAAIFEHNPYNPLTRVAVSRCPFDEDAVLLSRRTCKRLLRGAGLAPVEAKYIVFLPFDRDIVPRIERGISWLPLGAQHYVAARG